MNHSATSQSEPTNQAPEPSACISPLPWRKVDHANKSMVWCGDNYTVCQIAPGLTLEATDHANAAFIVKAVNSHAALVAALQKCRNRVNDFMDKKCNESRLEALLIEIHSTLEQVKE